MNEHPPKGSEEVGVYLTEDQIITVEKPEEVWKKCLEEVKSTTNWSMQFEACNKLRKICAHHSFLIVNSPLQLHGLVLDLLKIIESLRSSLAKNGLLVFAGIFKYI
jgi:hypothetical protein